MTELAGFQKKHLRGLAHSLKPVVLVGQRGLSDTLIDAVENALLQHELIKIKFNDFKEKEEKNRILTEIEDAVGASLVGVVGHTAILYRPRPDPAERNIALPGGE
jgi:RNA-binding protein